MSAAKSKKLSFHATKVTAEVDPDVLGSSLNVHVHFHVLVLDAVYAEEQGVLRFHPAPRPARQELAEMLVRSHARVMKWLGRRVGAP